MWQNTIGILMIFHIDIIYKYINIIYIYYILYDIYSITIIYIYILQLYN